MSFQLFPPTPVYYYILLPPTTGRREAGGGMKYHERMAVPGTGGDELEGRGRGLN